MRAKIVGSSIHRISVVSGKSGLSTSTIPPLDHMHPINHTGIGRDQIQVAYSLHQSLLNDFHMKQTKESAAKTRNRGQPMSQIER